MDNQIVQLQIVVGQQDDSPEIETKRQQAKMGKAFADFSRWSRADQMARAQDAERLSQVGEAAGENKGKHFTYCSRKSHKLRVAALAHCRLANVCASA